MMAIEFITQGTAYLYALEIGENAVEREGYSPGLGKKKIHCLWLIASRMEQLLYSFQILSWKVTKAKFLKVS